MAKRIFLSGLVLGLGIAGAGSAFGAVSGAGAPTIANNTPKFTATAKNLGTVNPSTVMEVSIWLNPHNKAELDATAKELYDPGSPSYRHWLSKAEFAEKYAPTAAEAKTVQDFFTSNGLKIVSVGPNNFYVRASGTAAAVSSAFHVTLNNYVVNGTTVRANASDPVVSGAAGPLVAAVAGLDTMAYTHPLVTRTSNLPAAKTPPGIQSGLATPAAGTASPAGPFDPFCFTGVRSETLTTDGSLPIATYTGNGYTSSTTGCGYVPEDIYTAYNLRPLYEKGLDGRGQTIVIIDWCGSPTITSDANAFSTQFGLPKLTASNFAIINTAPSYCAAPDPEINIDVEWAHAIAPGAAIDLVVPPSASFQDIDQGFFYAVNYQLGNVISGSYGSEEAGTAPATLAIEDLISETAAVLGISANFSSGDDGDFTFDLNNPTDYPASVSAPADSPYATGVGGISLALNADDSIARQIGWGTNINPLDEGSSVVDPPAGNGFFDFGSGGGPSAFFAKPSYQSMLAGSTRQVPDISWLADPYTGAYIAISEPFVTPELEYQVYGGTSLACPMFSALWAIANEAAGGPLGQAAPYLYGLPAGAITDIVPYLSMTNVEGKIIDAKGTTNYYSGALVAPLEGTTDFESALWNYPLEPGFVYLLSFGTDSGLKITPGYDNVTGVGVPNPVDFINAFKAF